MKKIKIAFKNLWRWWFDDTYSLEIIRQRKIERRFKRAKKIAIQKHKADNRTYYVILGPKDQYYVYNSFEIMQAKKRGVFKQSMTIYDVFTAASFAVSNEKSLNKG